MLEWFSTPGVSEVQYVTTSSTQGVHEVQQIASGADVEGLGGFWTLSFGGEMTELISWDAPADGDASVKHALEKLSSVGTVDVTRARSFRVVRGLRVSLPSGDYGKDYVTVDSAGQYGKLAVADEIYVAGEYFAVRKVQDGGATIRLGQPGDHTKLANVTGPYVSNARVSTWAFGYEWTVTFASQTGDMPPLVAAPADFWVGTNPTLQVTTSRDGRAPLSGTFRLGFGGQRTPPLSADASAADVEDALEALATLSDVGVSRVLNGFGHTWRVTVLGELGDVPALTVDDMMLCGPAASARVATETRGVAPTLYGGVTLAEPGDRYVIPGLVMGGGPCTCARSAGRPARRASRSRRRSAARAPSAPRDALIFALAPTSLKVSWQARNRRAAQHRRYRVGGRDADFSNPRRRTRRRVDQTLCYAVAISARRRPCRARAASAYNDSTGRRRARRRRRRRASCSRRPEPRRGPRGHGGVGLLVTWTPPSSELTCAYGGDGGGAIGEYAVEWDESPLFDSPASRALVPASALVGDGGGVVGFEIGGRDPMTGVESTLLVEGATYYVRVTAFNARRGARGRDDAAVRDDGRPTARRAAPSRRGAQRARDPRAVGDAAARRRRRSRSSSSRTTTTRASRRPRSRARVVSEVQSVVLDAP